jgi:hypothetical protein
LDREIGRVSKLDKETLIERALEPLFLFAAIAIAIPTPPSAMGTKIHFFPAYGLAIILFGVSRFLRHLRTPSWRLTFIAGEIGAFAILQIILCAAENLLLT